MGQRVAARQGPPHPRHHQPVTIRGSGAFTPAARAAILTATLDRCAGCGTTHNLHIHHRRPRGTGGTRNTSIGEPFNGVALCHTHHTWAETHRDTARHLGWLTPHPHPDHPYWTLQWGWIAWTLLDDGQPCWCIRLVNPPPGPAAAAVHSIPRSTP